MSHGFSSGDGRTALRRPVPRFPTPRPPCDGVFRRAETLEVGVAGDIRHLLHDDDRVIPECERAFEVVYLVVCILFQSPILQNRLDGIPCRFLQRLECLTGHHRTDILEPDT